MNLNFLFFADTEATIPAPGREIRSPMGPTAGKRSASPEARYLHFKGAGSVYKGERIGI